MGLDRHRAISRQKLVGLGRVCMFINLAAKILTQDTETHTHTGTHTHTCTSKHTHTHTHT